VVLILLIVLGALLGVGVLATFPPAASALAGPLASAQVNGLDLTLRIAPGPYFVRELLPVDVSLANHSNTTVYVAGHAGVNQGPAGFYIKQEGGTALSSPPLALAGCTFCSGGPGILMPNALAPGQSMSESDHILLTASGTLTLSVGVEVYTVTRPTSTASGRISSSDPFATGRPALHLRVAAVAPANRTLRVWRMGTHLVVLGPPQALLHLEYTYTRSMPDMFFGGESWHATPGIVIDGEVPADCARCAAIWSYAVGAPGYAVVWDTVTVG
jgi:hypothetical protein